MDRSKFYKDLEKIIRKQASIKEVVYGGLPASRNDALAVIDKPGRLDRASIDKKRATIFNFQLLAKTKQPLEGLNELERLCELLDMEMVGEVYIKLYTAPVYAYRDDSKQYVYSCLFECYYKED